jgi:tight adherence protein B
VIKDYDIYTYTRIERIQFFFRGALIGGGIGYLFYSSLFGVMALMLYGFLYVHRNRKNLIEERKWQLNLQFRDGLASVSSALNAGYSVENGFVKAVIDLKLMYPEDAYIVCEFEGIVRQIHMNQALEEVLVDFADRSGVEDIANFAEVFITAKRTGGDIIKIIRATESVISDKIEVKREIRTMITGKRFETNIMCIIPFCIILYLRMFSPGFLNPIYHNLFGVLFMTVLLIIYYFVYNLVQRITNIEV